MQGLIAQIQMLLTALSAFLPLLPQHMRRAAADVLGAAAQALAVGDGLSVHVGDLAARLHAVRVEIETIAAADRPVTAHEMDAAMARLAAASASFRTALAAAGAV